MISFFKAFPKHIKTAFLSIARHLAMSLSASSAVTITLVLFSAFLIVAGNVSLFTNSIENDLRIHVVLNGDVTEKNDLNQVKDELESISGVKRATFSSKADELELFIKERGEEFAMFKGDENPLSNAYFVSVKDADKIASITDKIKELPSVYSAVYGGNSVSKMISILNTVRTGGLVFVVLLSLLAIFLISNSIKMTIYARNKEIAIMRNVGATNGYIKVPFMIEGMLIGFIGSILPCIFTYFGYSYLFKAVSGQLMIGMFTMQPVYPFALQICGIITIAGMLVGLIGSFLSTTKYLRWKR
ncbi:MAG: permease-like cell division protein FtsX [Longicatena sp.]